MNTMGYYDPPDMPDPPEDCVSCYEPLTDEQFEAGEITCSPECAKAEAERAQREAEGEAEMERQRIEDEQKAEAEARAAGFESLEDYLSHLESERWREERREQGLPEELTPEEEARADLEYDAQKARTSWKRGRL